MSSYKRVRALLCRARRSSNGEGGQALIELMFVVPVVFALLLVILDGGFAFDRREGILHALREAGRSAASGDSPAAVVNVAVSQSDGILSPSNVDVCYIDGPDNGSYPGDVGDEVRISINYDYQTVFGGGLLSDIGLASRTFDMSPKAEAVLLSPTAGASSC
jgi:hypothetical protein